MKCNMGFIASVCLSVMPILVQAHPLAISNYTNDVLSFSVNGVCSNDFGTVYEREIKTISEENLNKACSNYASACEIMGYIGKNCNGKPVGGMIYFNEHSFAVNGTANSKISITGTESSLFYLGPVGQK